MQTKPDLISFVINKLRSRVVDIMLGRFTWSVVSLLIVVLFTKDSLEKEPNPLKWLMLLLITDVVAYFFGLARGFRESLSAIDDAQENDIIGGKGDRHEE